MSRCSRHPRGVPVSVAAATGLAAGVEALLAKVTQYLDHHPDHGVLSVDCKNAFGSVSRLAILRGVRRYAESLMTLFMAMYGTPNVVYLYLRSGKLAFLRATRGVRQGDALGPLFFMLGVARTLERLREGNAAVRFLSYIAAPRGPRSTPRSFQNGW